MLHYFRHSPSVSGLTRLPKSLPPRATTKPSPSSSFNSNNTSYSSVSSSSAMTTITETAPSKVPPVAKKVKHEMEMFGDKRIDNYYWLRDDCRSNPEVLFHLRQENSYTDFVMSGKSHLFHWPVLFYILIICSYMLLIVRSFTILSY